MRWEPPRSKMLRPIFAATHRELCILSVKDKREESIKLDKRGASFRPHVSISPVRALRWRRRLRKANSAESMQMGLTA